MNKEFKNLPEIYRGNCYILGDFNARIGNASEGWEDVRGEEIQLNECNRNGIELLSFCQQNGFKIANSFYRSPVPFTFKKPGSVEEGYAIDHILVPNNQWHQVRSCLISREFTDSDHYLLRLALSNGHHRQKTGVIKDKNADNRTLRWDFKIVQDNEETRKTPEKTRRITSVDRQGKAVGRRDEV